MLLKDAKAIAIRALTGTATTGTPCPISQASQFTRRAGTVTVTAFSVSGARGLSRAATFSAGDKINGFHFSPPSGLFQDTSQIFAGQTLLDFSYFLGRADGHHLAALVAAFGAKVDDVVNRFNHV